MEIILKIGDIFYFIKKKYDGRKNWQMDYSSEETKHKFYVDI